jgi:hypothetical protein
MVVAVSAGGASRSAVTLVLDGSGGGEDVRCLARGAWVALVAVLGGVGTYQYDGRV